MVHIRPGRPDLPKWPIVMERVHCAWKPAGRRRGERPGKAGAGWRHVDPIAADRAVVRLCRCKLTDNGASDAGSDGGPGSGPISEYAC